VVLASILAGVSIEEWAKKKGIKIIPTKGSGQVTVVFKVKPKKKKK